MVSTSDSHVLPEAGFTKLRELMLQEDLDALIVGPGAGFRQLLGRDANLTERMIALLLMKAEAILVVPRLQAPLYGYLPLKLAIWDEHEDPTLLASRLLQCSGCKKVGVNREFWSGFLMRFQKHAPSLEFTPALALDLVRAVKTDGEIAALRHAASRIDNVWNRFLDTHPVLTGKTEL
jgi:Xaa-Pro aminopeptidase